MTTLRQSPRVRDTSSSSIDAYFDREARPCLPEVRLCKSGSLRRADLGLGSCWKLMYPTVACASTGKSETVLWYLSGPLEEGMFAVFGVLEI